MTINRGLVPLFFVCLQTNQPPARARSLCLQSVTGYNLWKIVYWKNFIFWMKGGIHMHLDKCANGGEVARCRHNSRSMKNSKNSNINPALSKYNRNLTVDNGRTDIQRFRDRLEQLSYRKQHNNVRMEEVVISAPKNLPANEVGKFFKVAHSALQSLTGGAANEVSAWVHVDETTPHMHYLFVPGIEVDGVLKLSASKLMDRAKFRILHPEMQKAIDSAFGHHKYLVVADDPADRQQTSDTLQAYKSKMKKLDELGSQLLAKTEDLQTVMCSVEQTKRKLGTLNQETQDISDMLSRAAELCSSVKDYFSYDEWWQGQAELFGFNYPDNSKTYIKWMDSDSGQTYDALDGYENDLKGCIRDFEDLSI